MRTVVRRVDRLQRLAVFEAAARLGSFSAAGRELGLAQPAVTRQVRALELGLGIDLFDRAANRIDLTDAGHRLAAAIDVAFAGIEHALDELGRLDDVFVLAAPPGFAQQLIVPHLDSLQSVLGDRDLRLWLYDGDSELASGRFDAAVRVGTGDADWPELEGRHLFGEQVVPVAAPALAATWSLDDTSAATEVLAAPLLHMDAEDRPWMSWTEWLRAFDLELADIRRRVVFNNYPTVLQQAVAGRGIALGWAGLVEDLIADGLLTVVGPPVSSARGYWLTWPRQRPSAGVAALVDWLDERLGTD